MYIYSIITNPHVYACTIMYLHVSTLERLDDSYRTMLFMKCSYTNPITSTNPVMLIHLVVHKALYRQCLCEIFQMSIIQLITVDNQIYNDLTSLYC